MKTEPVQEKNLYSIRMHASTAEGHLSGAERIVPRGLINMVSEVLVNRAFSKEDPGPASVNIRVDNLEMDRIRKIPLLPIRTVEVRDPVAAEQEVLRLLAAAGVSEAAARSALKDIGAGPSLDGGNMRGGILMDARSGERLEPDSRRGVRVSRMDIAEELRHGLQKFLKDQNLQHYRVMEAVILASKAASIPGVLAEFCRSDDPGYTTGYVASSGFGYVRIHHIKRRGDPFGGRVFFVEPDFPVQKIIQEMEQIPYLISEFSDV